MVCGVDQLAETNGANTEDIAIEHNKDDPQDADVNMQQNVTENTGAIYAQVIMCT